MHTEFTQVAARPGAKRDRSPEFVHVSAEEVARAALAAIEHDRPLVIPGFIMKLGMFFVRIMPLSILRLASRFPRNSCGAFESPAWRYRAALRL